MSEPATEQVAADDRRTQLKAAGVLVAALAVVGAVLGVFWELWSPEGPAGVVVPGGIQVLDESENFVAGDGRFLLVTAIVGVLAAILAWLLRRFRSARGPYVALALAVGGIAGAALTELVGYLLRGDGTESACNIGAGRCIDHLPLTVHMHALLLAEAILAVLVYSLFVAFAVDDDLGRPDPARSAGSASAPRREPEPQSAAPVPSVATQDDPQQTWGDRDTAGTP